MPVLRIAKAKPPQEASTRTLKSLKLSASRKVIPSWEISERSTTKKTSIQTKKTEWNLTAAKISINDHLNKRPLSTINCINISLITTADLQTNCTPIRRSTIPPKWVKINQGWGAVIAKVQKKMILWSTTFRRSTTVQKKKDLLKRPR